MDLHNFYYRMLLLAGVSFVICTYVLDPVVSKESRYEACKPKSCGFGPNVSYPFFIRDNETDYCGRPGFGIQCEGGSPIYRTSGAKYIMKNIDYEKHSFLLVSLEMNDSTCPKPLMNYTFDRSSVNFIPYHADIVFFYNCTESFTVNYPTYLVTCDSPAKNKTFIALVHEDADVSWTKSACDFVVYAPIKLENGEINQTIWNIDYKKKLKDGFSLKWVGLESECGECQRSGGRCGFDADHSICYCPDGSHPKNCYEGNQRLGLKIGLGLGGPLIAIIAVTSLYFARRRYKQRQDSSNLLQRDSTSSRTDLEGRSVCFGISIFTYKELEVATNNFDSEKELGDGGFGAVYYGKLRDGREVAVKRLYQHNYRRLEQFMNEVKILTRLRHKNLVSLYGCTSRHSRELLLVYEFIRNGTVADHLHGDRSNSNQLTWPVRMRIAIETANALAYLHASDIVHRDVKTTNILLDSNFSVKVADFGLSRLFPTDVTHVSTAPQGTPGYVDPEYHQCYQLTDKSDVYSFGVVLIELISSMPAVDITRNRSEINLTNLAINKIENSALDELIDLSLGYQTDTEVRRMTTCIAGLAFQCIQQVKETRPTMEEVLEELTRIETGESKEKQEEVIDDKQVINNTVPPASPATCEDSALLKHVRMLPSPDSVTNRWVSSDSITPTVSGLD